MLKYSQCQLLMIQKRNYKGLAEFWPVHCMCFVCSLLVKVFLTRKNLEG